MNLLNINGYYYTALYLTVQTFLFILVKKLKKKLILLYKIIHLKKKALIRNFFNFVVFTKLYRFECGRVATLAHETTVLNMVDKPTQFFFNRLTLNLVYTYYLLYIFHHSLL